MLPKLEKVTQPEDIPFTPRPEQSNFSVFLHRHPEYELTLIQQGRGRLVRLIADYGMGIWSCRFQPLTPGPAKRCPAHDGTKRWSPTSGGFRQSLQPAANSRVLGALLPSNRGLQFHEPTREAISRRLGTLVDQEPFERVLELLAILHELARSRSARPLASAGYRYAPMFNNPGPRHIDKICEYIHQHFTEGVGEAEVARYAHMSPSAFSRSFRKLTGRTFKNYLNELRVGRACHLLRETEQPIMQICLESGFANLSNFNRRFVA